MTSSQKKNKSVARSRSREPVLITECPKKFAALRKALNNEIHAHGVIVRGLVGDLAAVTWDNERILRFKSGILNAAFPEALQNLLEQALEDEEFETYLDRKHAAKYLASRYFTSDTGKAEVLEVLAKCGLDEMSVEAEAFRMRAPELEALARMSSLNAGRRERDLNLIVTIAEAGLFVAEEARPAIDQAPAQDDVPQVVAHFKRGG